MSLTPTPSANDFVIESRRGVAQTVFPLDLALCRACAHVQLRDVVDPRSLYSDYVYVTGTWPVVGRYFQDYVAGLVADHGLRPGDLAIDIGSNDGTLLRYLAAAGLRTVGIDPARGIAAVATAAGIETVAAFFSAALAADIRDRHGTAACIIANNVLAHVDDLADVAEGVRTLLEPDGVFVFEVGYLADLQAKTLFDTIYHEHLSYYSVAPLAVFFPRHGLELIDVARTAGQGGSLRAVVQLAGGPKPVSDTVAGMIEHEQALGLDQEAPWRAFAERVEGLGEGLRLLIRDICADGKRVAGLGASAKATTLMYHFGLSGEDIEALYDDSLLKQGLYSPGLHLPVRPTPAIEPDRPGYLLILAWNHSETLMGQQQDFYHRGGRFIVPLPTVEVI